MDEFYAKNVRIKKEKIKEIKKKYMKKYKKDVLDAFDKDSFKEWENEVLDMRWDNGRNKAQSN